MLFQIQLGQVQTFNGLKGQSTAFFSFGPFRFFKVNKLELCFIQDGFSKVVELEMIEGVVFYIQPDVIVFLYMIV